MVLPWLPLREWTSVVQWLNVRISPETVHANSAVMWFAPSPYAAPPDMALVKLRQSIHGPTCINTRIQDASPMPGTVMEPDDQDPVHKTESWDLETPSRQIGESCHAGNVNPEPYLPIRKVRIDAKQARGALREKLGVVVFSRLHHRKP